MATSFQPSLPDPSLHRVPSRFRRGRAGRLHWCRDRLARSNRFPLRAERPRKPHLERRAAKDPDAGRTGRHAVVCTASSRVWTGGQGKLFRNIQTIRPTEPTIWACGADLRMLRHRREPARASDAAEETGRIRMPPGLAATPTLKGPLVVPFRNIAGLPSSGWTARWGRLEGARRQPVHHRLPRQMAALGRDWKP